jgi:hypothetical protein
VAGKDMLDDVESKAVVRIEVPVAHALAWAALWNSSCAA